MNSQIGFRFVLASFIIAFLIVFPWYFYLEMYAILTSNSFRCSFDQTLIRTNIDSTKHFGSTHSYVGRSKIGLF
jgi:hypothetical protein